MNSIHVFVFRNLKSQWESETESWVILDFSSNLAWSILVQFRIFDYQNFESPFYKNKIR